MQRQLFQKTTALCLGFFFVVLTAFTSRPGLDSYEIYLNSKLLLKQYVNQPLTLSSLQLTQKNAADELVVYYSQCNMPDKLGKNRRISVRDAEGSIIKTWKFADPTGSKTAMTIPVKDVLQLEKANTGKELSLFYTADGKSEGQLLANFHLGQKGTAYRHLESAEPMIAYQSLFSIVLPLCL